MQTVHVTHDFSAPVERVYEYLAEHEHLGALFGVRVERVRDGDVDRNGVGSVRRLSFAGLLPFEETVTAAEPNERIEYEVTKGSPLRNHSGVMVFSSTPTGSHLDYTIRFDAAVPGVAAIVATALRRSIPRGLAKAERETAKAPATA
mgnify:CR=1 FL=1